MPGSNSPAAYAGSVALLVLVSIPQFFVRAEDGDHSLAYRTGRVLGSVAIGLAVGYLICWIMRRSRPEPAPKWPPWVFLVAAGVVLLSSVSTATRTAANGDAFSRPNRLPAPSSLFPNFF